MTLEELRKMKPQLLELAAKYGVSNIRVFGSVARGEAREDSDIDLLVDVERSRTILDFVGFQMDAESLLHQSVDLISSQGIHPLLQNEIKTSARSL